jgi:hypothetical protein
MVLGRQVSTCNALKAARLTYGLVLPSDPLARSCLAIEKRMNDISNMVEANEKRSEERHRISEELNRQNEERHQQNKEQQECTNAKLDQVLAAVAVLTSQLQTKSVDSSDNELATIAPAAKLTLKNPPVTDALLPLIKHVIKTKPQRAEEKKGKGDSPEENSIRVSSTIC